VAVCPAPPVTFRMAGSSDDADMDCKDGKASEQCDSSANVLSRGAGRVSEVGDTVEQPAESTVDSPSTSAGDITQQRAPELDLRTCALAENRLLQQKALKVS
jgi:hypothetical protein